LTLPQAYPPAPLAAVRVWGVWPQCACGECGRSLQLEAWPQEMVKRNTLPLVYDPSRPARFGVLPKRPTSGKEVRARRIAWTSGAAAYVWGWTCD